MFEKFTEKAIKVIMLAQEESRRLGHNFVGTEQILLGLIGESTGIASKTLKQIGVNMEDARTEVERIIGRGSGFVSVEIPLTPRAKRSIELAWEESKKLNHKVISTEHLLLGLIRENAGVACHVLENLGFTDLHVIEIMVLQNMGIFNKPEELTPTKVEALVSDGVQINNNSMEPSNNFNKFFDVDPETGAYIPKPPTEAELEKMRKCKTVLLQEKYKYYVMVDNFIKFAKRLDRNIRRFIYRVTHPIEFLEAKYTTYKLKKMTQDPILMDALFQENINPLNLRQLETRDDG